MKKLLVFSVLLFCAASLFAQKRTFDTIVYLRGGKTWQLITFGNSDSVQINGIMFHPSQAGLETDPVWISDSVNYYTRSTSDSRYIRPSVTTTITGAKYFDNGKLILNGDAPGVYTTIYNLASGAPDSPFEISFPANSGTVALTSDIENISRYSAYSSGNANVEVLADSSGITATFANVNELTFTIPDGVKLLSAKIRIGSGFTTLKIFMGTTDMGNTSAANRWMPVAQAWREDTGSQLTGITTTMDLFSFDKFTVNGLINSTSNLIRITF